MTILKTSVRLAGAIGALIVAGCSSNGNAKPADTTASTGAFRVTSQQLSRIHIVAMQSKPFHPTIDATGTVAFNGNASTPVLAPISGPATRILADVGTTVQAGTPLALVSSPDFATAVAAYRKAQAAYTQAERIRQQNEQLFKNDALARRDLEQSETDAASAAADVDAAIQALRALGVQDAQIEAIRQNKPTEPLEAVIRSPIAGTVVERLINPGQLLAAGTTQCFTVADLSSVWVSANVFASDLKDVVVGEPAQIITDASHVPMPGKVDYVGAVVDPNSKAVAVRVLVPNVNHALRRDMFVRVEIESAHVHSGVLIPASALLRDEDNLPFVFVQLPDRSFNRRRITLGSRVDGSYEVTAGLAPGDKVVAEGALFIQFAETQ